MNKLPYIKLCLVPLFIFGISYSTYRLFNFSINDERRIFPIVVFLLFCSINILERFFEPKKGRLIFSISNKLMIILGFIFLSLKLGFPTWVALIVISREILLLTSWFFFYNLFPSEEFGREETFLGRSTFLFQMLVILLYLIYGMNQLVYSFTIVMVTLSIVSILDYIINV